MNLHLSASPPTVHITLEDGHVRWVVVVLADHYIETTANLTKLDTQSLLTSTYVFLLITLQTVWEPYKKRVINHVVGDTDLHVRETGVGQTSLARPPLSSRSPFTNRVGSKPLVGLKVVIPMPTKPRKWFYNAIKEVPQSSEGEGEGRGAVSLQW